MKTHHLISVLAAILAIAFASLVQAQPEGAPRRIGMLYPSAPDDTLTQESLARFRTELLKQGWTEGKNIQVEYRFSPNADHLPGLAGELVNLQPQAIFVSTTPAAVALKQATQSIPVVFVSVSNPVAAGLVESLARPGGNMTGFANAVISLTSKWLELLKDVDPRISRVGLMFNPETIAGRGAAARAQMSTAAPLFKVQPVIAEVRDAAEIEAAVAGLAGEPRGGLIVTPDIFNAIHRDAIIASAARHAVPVVYPFNFFSLRGGLLSYGVDPYLGHGQAAVYVSRILKGEKPADLPVQQPTKFELVINLKTAKALGLTISPAVLARADEVIE